MIFNQTLPAQGGDTTQKVERREVIIPAGNATTVTITDLTQKPRAVVLVRRGDA